MLTNLGATRTRSTSTSTSAAASRCADGPAPPGLRRSQSSGPARWKTASTLLAVGVGARRRRSSRGGTPATARGSCSDLAAVERLGVEGPHRLDAVGLEVRSASRGWGRPCHRVIRSRGVRRSRIRWPSRRRSVGCSRGHRAPRRRSGHWRRSPHSRCRSGRMIAEQVGGRGRAEPLSSGLLGRLLWWVRPIKSGPYYPEDADGQFGRARSTVPRTQEGARLKVLRVCTRR